MKRKAPKKQQKSEILLEAARVAQSTFWDALSELESELDIEIDGTTDLSDSTIKSLIEADSD